MCGLVGVLSLADFDLSVGALREMNAAIIHRGPDDAGYWQDESAGIALCHRRLSIIDLSAAGHQPMRSASGRYVIAYNGEIYNHRAIRVELEQAGLAPAWRGHSDTETLLGAISAWGLDEALRRCIGMFALALWDHETRELSLARDRMGEKPMYYGWQGQHFLFGSELSALHRHPAFRGEIDRGAVMLMMRHNYIPAPHSVFRGIAKLLPGTVFTTSASDREGRARVYWSVAGCMEQGLRNPFQGTPAEAVDALERLMLDSVGQQMEADVPLGAFLSGGIDSSLVVALMQAQSSRPVRTFTIGFNEPGYNEAQHAEAVARHLGTEHTELYVSSEEAMRVVPLLPTIYSEPFSDSSQIPTFLVSRMARQHVTVSLSGDGGDELFGGYGRYAANAAHWARISRLPGPARRAMAALLRSVSEDRWNQLAMPVLAMAPPRHQRRNLGFRLHKLASAFDYGTLDQVYRQSVSHWDPQGIVIGGGREPDSTLTVPEGLPACGDLHRMMGLDSISYLPDDILCKVDRAAMAVSLETRVPMLDHRVVEFAWHLPIDIKMRGGVGKWPLREVLNRYVPQALIDRPKMGFGVPIGEWLRTSLRDWAEDLLDERRLREEGLFNPEPIRQKWKEHLAGSNWQYLLWDVLMFQAWRRENS